MLASLTATSESLRIARKRRARRLLSHESLMAVAAESIKDTYVVLAQPGAPGGRSARDSPPPPTLSSSMPPPDSAFSHSSFATTPCPRRPPPPASESTLAPPPPPSLVSSPASSILHHSETTQVVTVTAPPLPPPLVTPSHFNPRAGASEQWTAPCAWSASFTATGTPVGPHGHMRHPTGQTFFGGIPGVVRSRTPSRFTPKVFRRQSILTDLPTAPMDSSRLGHRPPAPPPRRRPSVLQRIRSIRKRGSGSTAQTYAPQFEAAGEGEVTEEPLAESPRSLPGKEEQEDWDLTPLTHETHLFTPLPPRTPPLRRFGRNLARPLRALRDKFPTNNNNGGQEDADADGAFGHIWPGPRVNRLKPEHARNDPDLTLPLALFLVLAFTNACALTLLPSSPGLYAVSGVTLALGALLLRPSLWPLLHHATASRRGAACAALALAAAIACLLLEFAILVLKAARLALILEHAARNLQDTIAESLAELIGPTQTDTKPSTMADDEAY